MKSHYQFAKPNGTKIVRLCIRPVYGTKPYFKAIIIFFYICTTSSHCDHFLMLLIQLQSMACFYLIDVQILIVFFLLVFRDYNIFNSCLFFCCIVIPFLSKSNSISMCSFQCVNLGEWLNYFTYFFIFLLPIWLPI